MKVSKRAAILTASPLALAIGAIGTAQAQTDTQTVRPAQQTGTQGNPQASAPQAGDGAGQPAAQGGDAPDIVVTGIRESLTAAAGIKRNADQVLDAIVADDIGKFPDTTTAAALQRVPGVQVTVGANNEIVNPLIRGLGDVLTTLNGREIFTGAGRGFAFQDLPAEALAGADVYKSNSADLIEGGVAGLVNLKLHKPFDFKGFTLAGNVRGTYSRQADKVNPAAGLLISDRWDTGIGEIGALLDVSYSYNKYSQAIAFNSENRSTNIFPPDRAPRNVSAPTNVGGLNNFGNFERPQVNGSLQWQATPDLQFYADGLYAGYRAKTAVAFILYDSFSASSITNVETGDDCFDALVGADGFYPLTGPSQQQQLCNAEAMTVNNVNTITSNQASRSSTDLYLFAGGFHYDHERFKLNTDVSWQRSTTNRETFIIDIGKRVAQVDIRTNVGGGTQYSAPGNPLGDPTDFRLTNGLYQDNGLQTGELFAVKLDGSYEVGGFIDQIQAGLRLAKRDATSRQVIVSKFAPGGAYATQVSSLGLGPDALSLTPGIPQANGGDGFLVFDTDFLLDPANQRRFKEIYGTSTVTPPYDPTRSFDASERTYSGYLQAKYQADLGGPVSLDGLVGARLTKTDRTISGSGTVITGGVPRIVAVTRDTSDTDLLPNASARVKFGGGLQARLTYARTLARPAFGSLNPGLNYIVSTNPNIVNSGSSGNPDLRPQKADAFDATLEYYFGRSDYLSIGLFYKDIKDRVVGTVDVVNIGGVNYNISRPRNIGKAKLKGLEASAQKFFDFLPGALSGLGAFANFSYLDSAVSSQDDLLAGASLFGVSKYNVNAGLIYEKYGVSARAAYTYRSRYFDGDLTFGFPLRPVDQDVFLNGVRASGRLDISLNYDITKNITINLDALNVTRSKYKSFYDIELNPRDIRSYDDLYAIGLRFKF